MRYLWILALFTVGLLGLLVFTPVYDVSWGLIEIKEYKVINSKAVCGDKLCKEVDESRSKKGLSTRDIKVCGNEPCKYLDRADLTIPKNIDTPHGKYKFGIPLYQITCNEGLELILKASNNNPACVKAENAIKLIANGWALDAESQKRVLAESQERHSLKIALSSYGTDDLLSASFDKVYDQDFVVFEGIGWHRLHNVEVTISNESEIIDSVRSQTTDHGRLWMHWPIPESLPTGQYYIYATDGIHSAELIMRLSVYVESLGLNNIEKTKLRLNDITSSRFNGGSPIGLSGNLSTESGEFIPNAEILIVGDGPCPSDGIISKGLTDKFGRYHIFTETMIWDPSDNMIKIHAEYLGDQFYSPSSSQDEVIVVYPNKDTKSC